MFKLRIINQIFSAFTSCMSEGNAPHSVAKGPGLTLLALGFDSRGGKNQPF